MTVAIPAGPERPRPHTVTAAVALVLATAAVLAVQAAAYVYDAATFGDLADRAGRATGATGDEVSTAQAAVVDTDVFAVVVLAVAALLLVGAARACWRGRPGGRMLTLAVGVATLACCTGARAVDALLPASARTDLQAEIVRLRDADQPVWLTVVDSLGLLLYPLVVSAVVLLLLPSANRYFSRLYLAYLVPAGAGPTRPGGGRDIGGIPAQPGPTTGDRAAGGPGDGVVPAEEDRMAPAVRDPSRQGDGEGRAGPGADPES